ncbi:hypothetical protein LTR56_017331 [Elasticomyces elasticus]|nr:hypothetical protein LTR56_017331 [Elasticomyces elasticus]KAK3664461.1 hypothetical protein LTR22_004595 [Elasticomyces elasticus]KAK4931818.1 hypothetical protein LTR49_001883 [Elasticomyces elasticus]KAK5754710.1 hypothetical protein LTS12_015215 [Elasticomyces elasticus]
MTANSPDLLHQLPPELRLEIYQYALTSNYWLRRVEKEHPTFTIEQLGALLAVCTYVRVEARETLYERNQFNMTPTEWHGFSQSEDICRIRHIMLRSDRDLPDTTLTLALTSFENELGLHALQTANKLFSLESLTVGADHSHIVDMRKAGLLRDVDIGFWTLCRIQPFTIRVAYPALLKVWEFVRDRPSDASSWDDPGPYHHPPPNTIFRGFMMMRALALDARRGVALTNSPWFLRISALQRIQAQLITGAEHEGPRRLKDVDATCSQGILKWANDVIMEAIDVLGGPALVDGSSKIRVD